jgi:hypothetical protein
MLQLFSVQVVQVYPAIFYQQYVIFFVYKRVHLLFTNAYIFCLQTRTRLH